MPQTDRLHRHQLAIYDLATATIIKTFHFQFGKWLKVAMMAESFDLTRFYDKEEKSTNFLSLMLLQWWLVKDTLMEIGRNNEDSITLTAKELIQFGGCLPNIAVAVDSTDVEMIIEQGFGILGFQPQDGCLLSENPTEETPKRKNEHDVRNVPKGKKMRQEEQAAFGETLPYGNVTLFNSLTITPEQFQLHEVERMLVDNLYASAIRLRICNTMKNVNDCKQCDIESGFSPNSDNEMCIWKLTWKERIEKYFDKA